MVPGIQMQSVIIIIIITIILIIITIFTERTNTSKLKSEALRYYSGIQHCSIKTGFEA